MDDYSALLALLPESWRAVVLALLQLIAVFSLAIPVIEKLVKLTKTDKDDKALRVVQRVLSMFPRVQIPAISQRPPPPPELKRVEVPNWPTPDQFVIVPQQSKSPEIPPPPEAPKG